MQAIKRYYRSITPRTRFLIVYFLVMGFGASVFTRLANSLHSIFLLPAELILAVLAYREDTVRRDLPTIFGCAAIIWGLISATLNGSILTVSKAIGYWTVAATWFFLLRQSNRATGETVRQEFTAISTVMLTAYLPFVILALISLFSGRVIHIPGDGEGYIGIYAPGVLIDRIRVLSNPNICGFIEAVSILMAIYLFLTKKKAGWRVFVVIAAILNFMALTHTQSRTCIIALCIAIGILAFRGVYMLLFRRRGWRVAAALAAFVLAFFLMHTGSSLLFKADIAIASRTSSTIDTVAMESGTHVDQHGEYDVVSSGRGVIWRMTLEYLKAHPKVLAVGLNSDNVMAEIDGGAGLVAESVNVHNSLLDCVLTCGIPYMLIILVFLACMVPKCWRVLTGKCENAEYIFVAIIVLTLATSLTEVVLFTRIKIEYSIFMLAAGYVLLWDRDRKLKA